MAGADTNAPNRVAVCRILRPHTSYPCNEASHGKILHAHFSLAVESIADLFPSGTVLFSDAVRDSGYFSKERSVFDPALPDIILGCLGHRNRYRVIGEPSWWRVGRLSSQKNGTQDYNSVPAFLRTSKCGAPMIG